MTDVVTDIPAAIVAEQFAALLGAELLASAPDTATVRLPYKAALGAGRIHGGAISALVDIAATAAFWSHPSVGAGARGATVDFTVHFLRMAVQTDLLALAQVRRRGGSLCVADVSVRDGHGAEVAVGRVAYKLSV